jgi:hypothetical protein
MAWVNPVAVAAGDPLTETLWNQDVVANGAELAPFFGTWTTFTPQLRTATTNRTSTVQYARYLQVGKLVMVQARVQATAAGGSNQIIKLGLPSGLNPVNSSGVAGVLGTFLIQDTGTAFYIGGATVVEAGFIGGLAYGSVDNMGANTPAFTMASTDVIAYSVTYEVA